MKPTFFLAGALALALVPGAISLSGCGGGSSGGGSTSIPELRFTRQSNLEFPDSPEVTGILTVNFVDANPTVNARAAGTLQLFRTPQGSPTPIPFPAPAPGSPEAEFFAVVPANATYILVGNVVPGSDSSADIAVDLRGSYQGSPRFTLRGNFVDGAVIALEAPFERGNSVLQGRVTNVNNVTVPGSPTPTPTTVNTTAGTTTTGTTAGTTAGTTTAGTTTAGSTTAGTTTVGTTAGSTTAGATAGTTAGNTTAGTTAGSTTAGAITAGSTLGGGGTTDPPALP